MRFDYMPTKLSGMVYHQFKYSPKQWEKKTGENPLDYPAFFTVRNGLCGMTPYGKRIIKQYYSQVSKNWEALGVTA